MCTTPLRRPCVSGPPRDSMSTFSPVTERTTSGPVTNTRPPVDMITRSVSAGPYAAPPAAGPSTTEICGTRPEARIIAWNTRPTACSASTPSASRAPPECHSPMTGTRSRTARSIASTMCRQPSVPIAPPITVASVQKATAGAPSMVPRAPSTPLVSRGRSSRIVSASNSRASRSSGSRGSRSSVRVGAGSAVIWTPSSRPC